MTITSVRYDFGACTVEHVDRTADGFVVRVAQDPEYGPDEAIIAFDRQQIHTLIDRLSELEYPEVYIRAQLSGQKLGA